MITLTLPEDIFKPLFHDLALSGLIGDGKSLADAIPLADPKTILENYNKEKASENFSLEHFLSQYFEFPVPPGSGFITDITQSLEAHIHRLWPYLMREADKEVEGSSLIPLPYPYIVPGGRFNEIYYWDSYFTMLGLQADGKIDLIESMMDNFAWLIDEVGFVPNGNRTYFLSRSQPPFFSMMVSLLAQMKGDHILLKYMHSMEKEYHFWMDGVMETEVKEVKHIVHLVDDDVLNRYWDMLDVPRSEMYAEDLHLTHQTERPSDVLLQNIRSACESGWDFSSRWCVRPDELTSIHTCEILPIDLNCLIFHLETTIEKAFRLLGNNEKAEFMKSKSERRKDMIVQYFWNEEEGYFFDYDFVQQIRTASVHVAGIFPLVFGIADHHQGIRALQYLEKHLLKEGGLITTTRTTGQQWDAPNGWAPLQWMALLATIPYHQIELGIKIAERWTALNEKVFNSTGKMMEKYNVVDLNSKSGGGEYPVQDGFGWSNGVYLIMKKWLTENK
jgi:alpha,alpha-trehalase